MVLVNGIKYQSAGINVHISAVMQETRLLNRSIRENLRIVNPKATFDDLVEACRIAEIFDFIDSFLISLIQSSARESDYSLVVRDRDWLSSKDGLSVMVGMTN